MEYDANAIYHFQVVVTEQDGRLTAELKDLDDSSMDGRFAFTNTYNGFYQPNGERLVVLQGGVRQADGSLEQLYLESYRVSTNQPYDMTDELAALEKEHCAGYTQKEVSGALKGEAGNSEVKILVEYTKNETPETEGTLTIQVVNRNATPNSFTIVVTGPDDFRKEISSSELTDGQITLSDLKPGTYTVVESRKGTSQRWRPAAARPWLSPTTTTGWAAMVMTMTEIPGPRLRPPPRFPLR